MSTVKTAYELLSIPLLTDIADLKARWAQEEIHSEPGDFEPYRNSIKQWLARVGFADVKVMFTFWVSFTYLGYQYKLFLHKGYVMLDKIRKDGKTECLSKNYL